LGKEIKEGTGGREATLREEEETKDRRNEVLEGRVSED
jgi:hypothetical protein